MQLIRLTESRRAELLAIVHSDPDADRVRRAEAMLWLDDGECLSAVAARLGVVRQTIYNWVADYRGPGRRSLHRRVSHRRSPGRPSNKQRVIRRVAAKVLNRSPARYGYAEYFWSARLLRRHVAERHGVDASLKTVRRALRSLEWRYKRPRYTLARRSSTWRQAKGG